MTALLASVRSLEEAGIAAAGGADILDLKEPDAGALGAVSLKIAYDVVRFIGGRLPVSATVGDLRGDCGRLRRAVAAVADTGVDIVKVGLFEESERAEVLRVLRAAAGTGTRLVAVLFADRRTDLSVDDIAGAGFFGVMIDTAEKRSGSLRDHMDDVQLRRFVVMAQHADLRCGLAGSLMPEDIPALLDCEPDYLGFRGALCEQGQRGERLSVERLRAVRAAVRMQDRTRAGSATNEGAGVSILAGGY